MALSEEEVNKIAMEYGTECCMGMVEALRNFHMKVLATGCPQALAHYLTEKIFFAFVGTVLMNPDLDKKVVDEVATAQRIDALVSFVRGAMKNGIPPGFIRV